MATRKTATKIDPITVTAAALKACKCAGDYHTVESATEPETLQTAWGSLQEQEQTRLTNIVKNDTQANPKVIADELAACGAKLQLEAIKSHYGELAVKTAWKLLPQQERDRLTLVCKGESSEPVAVEQPAKKHNLIELTAELQGLDNLLDTVGDDITPELQTAINELLQQRDSTQEQLLDKLDNYCALIQSRLMWAIARKAEAERMAKLAETDTKLVDFLKGRLKEHLEAIDQKKLRTRRFNLSIRTAGGKQALRLNVENLEQLPQRFQRVTIEANNQLLRDALEAGDTEAQEVAYFAERSTYIAIN